MFSYTVNVINLFCAPFATPVCHSGGAKVDVCVGVEIDVRGFPHVIEHEKDLVAMEKGLRREREGGASSDRSERRKSTMGAAGGLLGLSICC
jgi:hypothetical protein